MGELRDWTKPELIGIARAHDRAANREAEKNNRERYSRHRRIAFTARKFARAKNI